MKNCTTDALPLLERDMPNTPYTLGWMRMEDFKRHAGVVLSLQREKNLVLLLVSSDGSVIPLLRSALVLQIQAIAAEEYEDWHAIMAEEREDMV